MSNRKIISFISANFINSIEYISEYFNIKIKEFFLKSSIYSKFRNLVEKYGYKVIDFFSKKVGFIIIFIFIIIIESLFLFFYSIKKEVLEEKKIVKVEKKEEIKHHIRYKTSTPTVKAKPKPKVKLIIKKEMPLINKDTKNADRLIEKKRKKIKKNEA